jgi:hypothetical protein
MKDGQIIMKLDTDRKFPSVFEALEKWNGINSKFRKGWRAMENKR